MSHSQQTFGQENTAIVCQSHSAHAILALEGVPSPSIPSGPGISWNSKTRAHPQSGHGGTGSAGGGGGAWGAAPGVVEEAKQEPLTAVTKDVRGIGQRGLPSRSYLVQSPRKTNERGFRSAQLTDRRTCSGHHERTFIQRRKAFSLGEE